MSKITKIIATPVSIRRIAPFRSALGLSKDSSFGIVKVETAAGVTGPARSV
jgi:hypothetical protein